MRGFQGRSVLVAASEGAKMAAPGGATVPLDDGSDCARKLRGADLTNRTPTRGKDGEACLAVC
jgi:hypothetical protein